MNFKELTLSDVSVETKVETLGIVLDEKLAELSTEVSRIETIVGPQGAKGNTGDKGPKGDQGKDGLAGKDGKNGTDGKDGQDGQDGDNGVSIQNIEIDIDDTLRVTLTDGSTLKTTKEVKGPKGDQGPQGLRGSNGNGVVVGGSTGQVLTKVSNTDYDVTWSTNGAGTVTSVGGTGTVNGLSLSGTVTSTGNLTLGGTLNLSAPPAIGATTPAAGTFTTITGQTEVLKGTGQNLFTYSQTFTNGVWSSSTATRADNQTTAPNGTTTAGTITTVNTTFGGILRQYVTLTSTTYTLSAYVKKNNYRYVGLRFGSVLSANLFAFFDFDTLATNTVGISGATLTATDAGSGWYRLALTAPNTTLGSTTIDLSTTASDGSTFTNIGAGQIVNVWGMQIELSSTANTYIPTTTTAVYGTPTLSFSGVAGLGLQSDGALYVSPAGTGALQAQATTSTTAGGNARGANAVDWQTARYGVSQVASGTTSVIAGGTSNTASGGSAAICGGYDNRGTGSLSFIGGGTLNTSSGQYSVVSGGSTNTASNTVSTVSGGFTNTASAYASVVSGGQSNTASGQYSVVSGGASNTSAGFYNVINGGFTNTGTALAAVTTQSGTMNATTAVTLSGSNANIKVGQYITGTSISSDTYVAAISGTALTLSKVASGSSTSTLSFFTPHGVVVGGGNNQATGSYSFIGGGGDAGTAANRNVASGDWSFVGCGRGNQATGAGSVVAGGGWDGVTLTGNTSSGPASAVLTGLGNTASGSYAVVLGGLTNTASGNNSSVLSGAYGTSRGLVGNTTFVACNSPIAVLVGASQSSLLVLARQTTDATPTALASNSAAAGTNNQVILPNNSAYYFRGEVVSGVTGGGNTKGWTIEGVIKRGANAASTALVGTPTVVSTYADVGAATWAIAVTADTTNGGIRVTFTGQASTTIRTVCQIRTTEMTY